MFLAYLDETGTGKIDHEPCTVVAGVLVHADMQWKVVTNALRKLADDFALPEDRAGFVFHATDLYNGGKKDFYKKYPEEKRHAALKALCELPSRFNLPIAVQSADRRKLRTKRPELTSDGLNTHALVVASLGCAIHIEKFLRLNAGKEEVAALIYEQNGGKSKHVRDWHNAWGTDRFDEYKAKNPGTKLARFDRVIETAMFARKGDSSLLQLPDTAAYIFGRMLRGAQVQPKYFEPLRRQLIAGPVEWTGIHPNSWAGWEPRNAPLT